MNGLQRGTLTEMRINVIYMGQFKDEWVMGILAKKLTSDWSDTVAKWLKHLALDQKVPGLNPNCCFTGKVFTPPPLGRLPSLCLKGPGGINYTLLPFNCPCAYGKIYTMQLQLQTNWFMSSKPPTDFLNLLLANFTFYPWKQ